MNYFSGSSFGQAGWTLITLGEAAFPQFGKPKSLDDCPEVQRRCPRRWTKRDGN